jgi:hypothetical protein
MERYSVALMPGRRADSLVMMALIPHCNMCGKKITELIRIVYKHQFLSRCDVTGINFSLRSFPQLPTGSEEQASAVAAALDQEPMAQGRRGR